MRCGAAGTDWLGQVGGTGLASAHIAMRRVDQVCPWTAPTGATAAGGGRKRRWWGAGGGGRRRGLEEVVFGRIGEPAIEQDALERRDTATVTITATATRIITVTVTVACVLPVQQCLQVGQGRTPVDHHLVADHEHLVEGSVVVLVLLEH